MRKGEALEAAKALARNAASTILEYYSTDGVAAQTKTSGGRKSPVTQADLAAHRVIAAGLRERFSVPVLSEEDDDDPERLESEYVWIVDPLDGTREFVAGRDEFTVNIALVKDGEPVLGVIAVPAREELYFAVRGEGCFCERGAERERLRVSSRSEPEEMVVARSRSHAGKELHSFMESLGLLEDRPAGSSVKGCLVAAGEADLYPRFGRVMEWDVAAMHAIVSAAGGRMTRLDGSPITYNKEVPEVLGFIVSNDMIHDALVEEAKKHG